MPNNQFRCASCQGATSLGYSTSPFEVESFEWPGQAEWEEEKVTGMKRRLDWFVVARERGKYVVRPATSRARVPAKAIRESESIRNALIDMAGKTGVYIIAKWQRDRWSVRKVGKSEDLQNRIADYKKQLLDDEGYSIFYASVATSKTLTDLEHILSRLLLRVTRLTHHATPIAVIDAIGARDIELTNPLPGALIGFAQSSTTATGTDTLVPGRKILSTNVDPWPATGSLLAVRRPKDKNKPLAFEWPGEGEWEQEWTVHGTDPGPRGLTWVGPLDRTQPSAAFPSSACVYIIAAPRGRIIRKVGETQNMNVRMGNGKLSWQHRPSAPKVGTTYRQLWADNHRFYYATVNEHWSQGQRKSLERLIARTLIRAGYALTNHAEHRTIERAGGAVSVRNLLPPALLYSGIETAVQNYALHGARAYTGAYKDNTLQFPAGGLAYERGPAGSPYSSPFGTWNEL